MLVTETKHATNQNNKITLEEVTNAFEWAENHIVCKEDFKSRPRLMNVRMFDRFTNSNAEAEHSALKKKSLGLQANGSLHQLYKLSEMDARRRQTLKQQDQCANMNKTDTKTKCPLSSYITKYCFQEMKCRVEYAKRCISKQLDYTKWQVIYRREKTFNDTEVNSYLPYIQRIRIVTKSADGHLECSCKCYPRHGYPCHHLLHVLRCYDTSDILREWIHIRWVNVYSKFHYSNDCTEKQRSTYETLYDSFPIGPRYNITTPATKFPLYDAFDSRLLNRELFNKPPFQIVSRKDVSREWRYLYNNNDPTLKGILDNSNDSLIDTRVFSSSQNTTFSQSLSLEIADDDNMDKNEFPMNIDEDEDIDEIVLASNTQQHYPDNLGYKSQHVIFKRAVDLCGNNVKEQRRLYDVLSEFVYSLEINHNDNSKVMAKRNKVFLDNNRNSGNNVTIVSSNKVTNKYNRSCKRKKAAYET